MILQEEEEEESRFMIVYEQYAQDKVNIF